MNLRRLGPGQYETADGRFLVERQDDVTECTHPYCDPLHRARWSYTRGGVAVHDVEVPQWHVWDVDRDDYAHGNARGFATKRAAVEWLERFLDSAPARS